MRLVGLLLLAFSTPVWAWESVCREYADRSLPPSALSGGPLCSPAAGPQTARQRWVGELDEHRALFERARVAAGIPGEVSDTFALSVFTSAAQEPIGSSSSPTLIPVPFSAAERVQLRYTSIGEFAQLPDFSYGLWDWASGHETCAFPEVENAPEACHDFASHMGPVNANHFLPLAKEFYRHYHALALARAGACGQMKSAVSSSAGRFSPYLRACELEALTLEAVAQHYLQDSWSMGHMWQRWGSPELNDFPGSTVGEKREAAVLVALVSGLLHGSRAVLQRLPEWTSYDVNDALCAPHPDVRYAHPVTGLEPAVGDDYFPALVQSSYQPQTQWMDACAVAGLLEVYQAAGENHGPALPSAPGISVQPGSDACFAQRATNASLLAAAAVDFKLLGIQHHLALDARVVGTLLPKVATEQGAVEVSPATRARFRLAMQRFVTLTRLQAKLDPDGTQVAEGALGDFMGVKPNGAFVPSAAAVSYLEPPLPWPQTPTVGRADHALSLAGTFHRAHASDWCQVVDGPALSALVQRAQDTGLPPETRSAACEVCAEIAVRHLRVGAPGNYDTAREPLCSTLAPDAAVIYQAGGASDDSEALARTYCGC